MPGTPRRQSHVRPSWWTSVALAAGAVLLLVGGYLQLSSNPSTTDEGRQPTAAGPSASSHSTSAGTTTAVPTKPSSTATSPRSTRPPATASSVRANPANPVRLTVPSLGVSARALSIRAG